MQRVLDGNTILLQEHILRMLQVILQLVKAILIKEPPLVITPLKALWLLQM
jgi:hypothetical protein